MPRDELKKQFFQVRLAVPVGQFFDRSGGEHVAAVLVHLSRRMPAAAAGPVAEPATIVERESWPSDSAISASFTPSRSAGVMISPTSLRFSCLVPR